MIYNKENDSLKLINMNSTKRSNTIMTNDIPVTIE